MRMYYACPECRVIYGRESGYFTGAMIVSYILAVPVLAVLTAVIALFTGWRFDVVLLIAGLYFLIFLPMLFRYSRHLDALRSPGRRGPGIRALRPAAQRSVTEHDDRARIASPIEEA